LEKVDRVLRDMAAGHALHLTHAEGGPIWRLSDGKRVTNSVAMLVVASVRVAGVGDSLFDQSLSQTFRWLGDVH
jgi:hypothetical protein